MEPEELATYVRRAEQAVLPIIKEKQLGPGAAQFLLAQFTAVFVSGHNRVELESGIEMWEMDLALWQGGFYTPGPEYPFTLEETLQDIESGGKARGDYAESFQVFRISLRISTMVCSRSRRTVWGETSRTRAG